MTPGARVLPTRSKPNRRLAAERGRTGVVGNTGSLGLLHSAKTAETAEGSGSHKVLHVLVNSRTSSAYFSTTRDVTSKSSSDLDRGRRPKLKSEEFCEVTSLVVEIICDFCEIAGRSSCTLWEPDP